MRKLIIAAIICLGVLGSGIYYLHSRTEPVSTSFRTAKVERGLVVSEVSCSGTVDPVTTVEVGAQVSGKIRELMADFNSEVTEGQLIARIEPETFEARVAQAEADLKVALANVEIRKAAVERAISEHENARSDLASGSALTEKARVAAVDAKREFERMQSLHESESIPVRQFEQAEAAYAQSAANLKSTRAQQEALSSGIGARKALLKMERAQLLHSKAQVEHRQAALVSAKIELGHSAIRSPVTGVVISRNVDVGQTVLARLKAPTLFVIARDLRKMQIEASVDEADIGRILVGRDVRFTVDAYPGREFSGKVEQIRKEPREIQNVVTYTVVATADNLDSSLLPGMTASVRVVVKRLDNILKVPNAALRFQPADTGTNAGKSTGEASPTAGSPRARLQRVIETLDLTEDQQEKVWAMFDEAKTRVFAKMAQGAGPDQVRLEIEKERQRMKTAMTAMLTPEQKEKQERLEAESRMTTNKPGRLWVIGEDGKPKPVDVKVGITDGECTQLVSDNLKEGRRVILGLESAQP